MTAIDTRKQIQSLLAVVPDGQIGVKSLAALNRLVGTPDDAEWPPVAPQPQDSGIHAVIGSSFADPADVAAYRKCKSDGGSEEHCLGIGDNGVGRWGDDCTEGSGPAVALPPEDWEPRPVAHLAPVKVTNPANGKSVIALLKDTMPHKANIKNGAGIDMNPDTCDALGLTPPVLHPVTWQWA